jgi:predicted Rdx family selenoprotein
MNNKFLITSFFNDVEEDFRPPNVGITYNTVILDIRNIWEKDNHSGFNLELKETYVNI